MLLTLLAYLIPLAVALPSSEKTTAPGMIDAKLYSGYLKNKLGEPVIHYVFAQADETPDTKPLLLWLNGGPGCSSLIGFLQELGPYKIGNKYVEGQLLNKNPYSWTKVANLLFLQSPAVVGFSLQPQSFKTYTDEQTADDAFAALKDFLFSKAPQFKNRKFYISGESYAGKYLPDIAVRIIEWNKQQPDSYIQLKGMLVGNGVMNFEGVALTKSQIEYMIEHDFISQKLVQTYRTSCSISFSSPRCRFFMQEFNELRSHVNHYNVYEVCSASQQIEILRQVGLAAELSKSDGDSFLMNLTSIELASTQKKLKQGIPECPNDEGAIQYWNFIGTRNSFHVENSNKKWSPCSKLIYEITSKGSMSQYEAIFLNRGVDVWLYNGDFDDVVPFVDTVKNLKILRRSFTGVDWKPWFTSRQHSGFFKTSDKITLLTVKGAGHMVPQDKPAASLELVTRFLSGNPMSSSGETN